jgi:hypothetical protein
MEADLSQAVAVVIVSQLVISIGQGFVQRAVLRTEVENIKEDIKELRDGVGHAHNRIDGVLKDAA